MDFLILLTFVVAFGSSILSGIAGVGGGFIMAPYWLLIGLSPAQSAANGSFMAIGMGASSLAAFRKTSHFPKSKKLVLALVIIAFVSALIGGSILPHVQVATYKPILAIITIISLPLLFVNRKKTIITRKHKIAGVALFSVLILVGSVIFSSAFSILIAIVLATFFGFNTLQSTVLRRILSTVQVAVLFSVLLFSGNIIWVYAFAGMAGGVIGSYLGTAIAIKKGEMFAKYALAAGALLSSAALLFY